MRAKCRVPTINTQTNEFEHNQRLSVLIIPQFWTCRYWRRSLAAIECWFFFIYLHLHCLLLRRRNSMKFAFSRTIVRQIFQRCSYICIEKSFWPKAERHVEVNNIHFQIEFEKYKPGKDNNIFEQKTVVDFIRWLLVISFSIVSKIIQVSPIYTNCLAWYNAQKTETEWKGKKEEKKPTLCLQYYIHVGLFKPSTKEVPTSRLWYVKIIMVWMHGYVRLFRHQHRHRRKT